eukprot:5529358-Pyramimonas_sp.AAC.1
MVGRCFLTSTTSSPDLDRAGEATCSRGRCSLRRMAKPDGEHCLCTLLLGTANRKRTEDRAAKTVQGHAPVAR